jgi:hypothetical protein
MKLDRSTNPDGRGKYALIKLRNLPKADAETNERLTALNTGGFVEFGNVGDDDEFFVIKLKDAYAAAALTAYAQAALADDPEYANEILQMAARAALHPQRHKPD